MSGKRGRPPGSGNRNGTKKQREAAAAPAPLPAPTTASWGKAAEKPRRGAPPKPDSRRELEAAGTYIGNQWGGARTGSGRKPKADNAREALPGPQSSGTTDLGHTTAGSHGPESPDAFEEMEIDDAALIGCLDRTEAEAASRNVSEVDRTAPASTALDRSESAVTLPGDQVAPDPADALSPVGQVLLEHARRTAEKAVEIVAVPPEPDDDGDEEDGDDVGSPARASQRGDKKTVQDSPGYNYAAEELNKKLADACRQKVRRTEKQPPRLCSLCPESDPYREACPGRGGSAHCWTRNPESRPKKRPKRCQTCLRAFCKGRGPGVACEYFVPA